jgi:peptidoglycan/xylan/chitin deacetylase (PgdA/CDA1 family)
VFIRAATTLRVDELALRLQRWLVNRGRSPRLLVIEMHETRPQDEALFRKQLEWVAQRFDLVDLDTFAQLWQEYRHDAREFRKTPLLFTFDDGRANNYTTAAPLLEFFGTRGVFFVIPQWVQCSPPDARDFYYSRIDTRPPQPDHAEEDWRAMTPQQIADLSNRGHAIGNHTFSHANLASLPDTQLRHEIIESASQISSWTGRPVDAFAWTFSWDSITPAAWKLIRQHHRFCFAPCPGSVDCGSDSDQLIWRTEVEVLYPPAHFRFMYSGLADPLWRKQRARLRALLKD